MDKVYVLERQGQKDPNYKRHPGSIWIDNNRERLPENEWVAADAFGLIAHSPTQDDLLEELSAKEIEFSTVTIAFNDTGYRRGE